MVWVELLGDGYMHKKARIAGFFMEFLPLLLVAYEYSI
jgi:hypothetical protein